MGEGNIEVKVQEAGTVLLILGTMLGGGTFCSDTRRTPFPLLVADGLQWKGKKGQADCDVWRLWQSVVSLDPWSGASRRAM